MIGTGTFNIITAGKQIILETSDFGNFTRDKSIFGFSYRDNTVTVRLEGTDNLSFERIAIARFSFDGVAVISYEDFKSKLSTAFPNEGGGSSTPLALEGLTDVQGTTAAPDGKVLKKVAGVWQAADDNTGSGGGAGGGMPESFVNVIDYGATGDGVTDDRAAIQAAINYAINNSIVNVFFPGNKNYKVTNSIIVISGGSETPNTGYVKVNLIGEANFWHNSTQITATFKDRPIIAIQKGKGCEIRGLSIMGIFNSPPSNNGNERSFWSKKPENFVTDGSRDLAHSPYCGIAIDPFTAVGTPADVYPGLSAYYNLGGSTSAGSTDIWIHDCRIDKTVIAIGNSLNGQLRNAELTLIERVYFGDFGHKWCVVGTQAQEKVNIIRNCASWGSTYGFFSSYAGLDGTSRYGYGVTGEGSTESGNWTIHDINLAGAMVEFIRVKAAGWFPTYVSRIYGEQVGKIGIFSGNGATFKDSMIDFTYPESSGYLDLLECESPNTLFEGNTFRYYGSYGALMPMNLNRGFFRNCNFSGAFHISANGTGFPARFESCSIENANIPFAEKTEAGIYKNLNAAGAVYQYGNTTLKSLDFNGNILVDKLEMKSTELTRQYYAQYPQASNIVLTNGSFVFSNSTPNQFVIGGLVDIQNGASATVGWGRVTAINANDITVSYTSPGVVNGGTYYVIAIYPVLFTGTFTGDFEFIAGVQYITNIQMDWGTAAGQVGAVFFDRNWSANLPMKITAYDAGQNRFTVENGGSQSSNNKTEANLYFAQGTRKHYESPAIVGDIDDILTASERTALQKNSLFTLGKNSDKERIFKILTSGYHTGTPLATWIEI